MSNITPFITTFRLVENDGTVSVEFKRYLDQIFERIGGVTGGSYKALTDAANIVWDVGFSPVAVVVLGGNRILSSPANMVAGLIYRLTIVQDTTGSRTLTYGSAYKFPGGAAPTLSTAANAVDEMWFSSDGTNMKLMVFNRDIR